MEEPELWGKDGFVAKEKHWMHVKGRRARMSFFKLSRETQKSPSCPRVTIPLRLKTGRSLVKATISTSTMGHRPRTRGIAHRGAVGSFMSERKTEGELKR